MPETSPPSTPVEEQPCRCTRCLAEALRQLPRTAYSEGAQALADALLARQHGYSGTPKDWPSADRSSVDSAQDGES